MELTNFDVASDAFSRSDPFKSHLSFSFMVLLRIIKQNSKEDLLTKHPIAVSEFLTSNYNEVFSLLK